MAYLVGPYGGDGRAPNFRWELQYGNFDHITMALMPYVNIKVTEKKTNLKFQVLIRLARLFFIIRKFIYHGAYILGLP